MENYLSLSGKVALVTGASSGIGAATASVLAELGAKVALSYHSNKAGAEEVRDKILAAVVELRSPSTPTFAKLRIFFRSLSAR